MFNVLFGLGMPWTFFCAIRGNIPVPAEGLCAAPPPSHLLTHTPRGLHPRLGSACSCITRLSGYP